MRAKYQKGTNLMDNILPFGGKSDESPFDQIKQTRPDGSEFWSARDLSHELEYDQWRRFEDAIERAIAAIENIEMPGQDHIAGAGKMIEAGKGAQRYVSDYHLTRYGAYILAMNCDPRKTKVAEAQTYFAIKTRQAEVASVRELTFEEKALEVIGELQRRTDEHRAEAERAKKELVAVQPLVAQAKTYQVHAKSISRQEFAREAARWGREEKGITILQAEVITFLSRKLHLFIAGHRADNGHATADAEKRFLAETKKGTAENGHNYATGKLTPKGQEYAWKHIVAYVEDHGHLRLEGDLSA